VKPSKLYIIARRDLSAGQKIVQVAHALAEFMRKHGHDT